MPEGLDANTAPRGGQSGLSATFRVLIREIAKFGGDVSHFVHPLVAERIRTRVAEQARKG